MSISFDQACPKLSKVGTLGALPPSIPRHNLRAHTDRTQGVLVECDPSIKAIILKIDQDKHDFIVEDLDDQTLVVKESQLQKLKARLEEVRMDFDGVGYRIGSGLLTLRIRNWRILSNNRMIRARIDFYGREDVISRLGGQKPK